jgi:hypothetical protein
VKIKIFFVIRRNLPESNVAEKVRLPGVEKQRSEQSIELIGTIASKIRQHAARLLQAADLRAQTRLRVESAVHVFTEFARRDHALAPDAHTTRIAGYFATHLVVRGLTIAAFANLHPDDRFTFRTILVLPAIP